MDETVINKVGNRTGTGTPLSDKPDRNGFDVAWKYLLEEMFPDFMTFYFPAVAQTLDWEAGWTFLNQELQQIHPDAKTGNRTVDKLVKVRGLDDEPDVLFIHIEVQSQPQKDFAERMFIYFYRIFDHFRRPVTSLAVLADASPGWRPDAFDLRAPGARVRFSWTAVKLLDFRGREAELRESDNPFAWMTLAHLAALRTQGRLRQRQKAKRWLIHQAASHGWERERIIGLFKALDFMMRLPPELNRPLWREAAEKLGEETVELMFSFEEEALQRGRQEGIEKGREAEAALICRQLTRRFGPLPEALAQRVGAGTFDDLERWGARLLDVNSLDEVFAGDD